jgi:hypothetical protein
MLILCVNGRHAEVSFWANDCTIWLWS